MIDCQTSNIQKHCLVLAVLRFFSLPVAFFFFFIQQLSTAKTSGEDLHGSVTATSA